MIMTRTFSEKIFNLEIVILLYLFLVIFELFLNTLMLDNWKAYAV